MYLSFTLPPEFVNGYTGREVPWGYDMGGGNSLGEVTYLRTYARPIDPDFAQAYGWNPMLKERWFQCLTRVINGTFSLLKDRVLAIGGTWDEPAMQAKAQDAFERAFVFKWSPPGRGLWMMGTRFVHERGEGAALNNCGFVSTSPDDGTSFGSKVAWLMEMSMLGVGVGFDTEAAGRYTVQAPNGSNPTCYRIPDTREGWSHSVERLVETYLSGGREVEFDYSALREEGASIAGFGGKAAGARPLVLLHEKLRQVLGARVGQTLTSVDVTDVMNLVAKCVVAGNVRRSALIALGEVGDTDFLNLKNPEVFPERNDWDNGWGHLSNNTIRRRRGQDLSLAEVVESNFVNGEPGFYDLALAQDYGRLIDPPNFRDRNAKGTNPCGEQQLESYELCCLVETYPTHAISVVDYLNTLEVAHLYAKAVTLAMTWSADTNRVIARNRRMGASMSGVAQFVERFGATHLARWCDEGYHHLDTCDEVVSRWLDVNRSIKLTSVKPSGTVSLLAGVTPGAHWPTYDTYIRRMRFSWFSPLVEAAQRAGFHVEPDVKDPNGTAVISFPVRGPKVRTERQVPVEEKVDLAILLQRYWADNSVSLTVTFLDEERPILADVMRHTDGKLKAWSLLPIWEASDVYPQMPYEACDDDRFTFLTSGLETMDLLPAYAEVAVAAEGERGCSTDVCEVKSLL